MIEKSEEIMTMQVSGPRAIISDSMQTLLLPHAERNEYETMIVWTVIA